MTCPLCRAAMTAQTFEGHLGTSVTIDLCMPCQVFWFDARESLQLSPGAVLELFRLIGEHPAPAAARTTNDAACPRCGTHLVLTHDQQRNTKFQYLRCPQSHGRLTGFVDFLREKNFIKPMSAEQVDTLRRSVGTVNCSNCGAPIDLARQSACEHCGSPLSMVDMTQAAALVAELKQASQPRQGIDPALPLELERARREVETAFAAFERTPGWSDEVSRGGLVGAGLAAITLWMKEQG